MIIRRVRRHVGLVDASVERERGITDMTLVESADAIAAGDLLAGPLPSVTIWLARVADAAGTD